MKAQMFLAVARSAANFRGRAVATASALILLTGCAFVLPLPDSAVPEAGSYRIYDMRSADFISFAELQERLSEADAIFFGEQHNDSIAHELQRRVLAGIGNDERPVALGLESFERDVQPRLDAYGAGTLSEDEFLASSRPWPNYRTAYRPLVELAKERGWAVFASNAPRSLAARVAQRGLGTLQSFSSEERGWVARDVLCPRDAYFDRFALAMRGSAGEGGTHGHGMDKAAVERFYEAQCLKDETMAESIAQVLREKPEARVLHVHGSFHSDYGQGVVERLKRRVPAATLRTISAIPVEVPGLADPTGDRGRADFLIFTRAGSQ